MPRLLILGAHPDDAEFHAGGLACIYRELGHPVKMVSVTNGQAGHYDTQRTNDEFVAVRRNEAAASGAVIGAEYVTWDFPDSGLQATLEVRAAIVREIRTFQPDLVLTHRPNDYHPDHRAVGQAVQDASYMVIVPRYLPEVPALRKDPVVAYMVDTFTKPCPLDPDVVLDTTDRVDTLVKMMSQHESQFFDWLPYAERRLEEVPADEAGRAAWLRGWFHERNRPRVESFREMLVQTYGAERGRAIEFMEAYEISEYAGRLDDELRATLFPVN
ncbi:MAG: PIG-L deacetylase family protein [Planctomycetales bacterium]